MATLNNLPQGEAAVTLWTNPSPSAAFAAQTITLSAAANTYRKLRIIYKRTNSNTENLSLWADYDLGSVASEYAAASDAMRFVISMKGTSYYYARYGEFTDSTYTKINWSTAYRLNSTSGHNTNYCIPIYVQGIR